MTSYFFTLIRRHFTLQERDTLQRSTEAFYSACSHCSLHIDQHLIAVSSSAYLPLTHCLYPITKNNAFIDLGQTQRHAEPLKYLTAPISTAYLGLTLAPTVTLTLGAA